MSLSSSLGSAGLKPGVCTSATRPASPFEGQVIYETDTDRTLVWDNSAWVLLAKSSGSGLVYISTTNVGASATVDVSDVFSADYTNYRVIISNVGVTSGPHSLNFINGSTIYATDGYYGELNASDLSSDAAVGYSSNNSPYITIGAPDGGYYNGSFDVLNPYLSSPTVIPPTGSIGGLYENRFSGYFATAVPVTGFRITFDNGATGGTIRVYGYNE